MDRVHRRFGGVGTRARAFVVAAVVAGLVLAATAVAALPTNVAVVVGKPISRQQFNHWMRITAKGQGGTPLIVPTNPPRFDRCIAQARAGVRGARHDSTRSLRRDCMKLFTSLSNSVLDLLIRTAWDELEAARDGIVVTKEQVDHRYAAESKKLFPTRAGLRLFLRESGQTVADVKFRVRGGLVFAALRKAEHLSSRALEAKMTRTFKARTSCARFYVMPDCAGG
jgi:hypothetical protein